MRGGPLTWLKEDLRARRDALLAGLSGLKGFSALRPAAGYYVFAGIRPFLRSTGGRTFKDSASLARALLEKASVALLPGSAFGLEEYVRMTFAPTPIQRIEEGVNRLRAFFKEGDEKITASESLASGA
jgi:aspartate aminotransferase